MKFSINVLLKNNILQQLSRHLLIICYKHELCYFWATGTNEIPKGDTLILGQDLYFTPACGQLGTDI